MISESFQQLCWAGLGSEQGHSQKWWSVIWLPCIQGRKAGSPPSLHAGAMAGRPGLAPLGWRGAAGQPLQGATLPGCEQGQHLCHTVGKGKQPGSQRPKGLLSPARPGSRPS